MTNLPINGLTSEQAKALQVTFGRNELTPQKKTSFFRKVLHIIAEPMFLLLLIAAVIYFVLGEPRDGAIMLIFVLGVISIDVIQEWKTDRTLSALKELSSPRVQAIRDGIEQSIFSVDLVPSDVILLCEGVKIPADGIVLRCNDLCVDESSLTGEAEGVWKCQIDDCPPSADYWRKDYCYAGTLVTLGTAAVRVEKIGAQTEYGKIGANVAAAPQEDTPLQKQTGRLVKICAGIAAVLFALVGTFTFINLPDHMPGARFIESILSGITLAMAMIPEEFPVILTVFLSMGAWRLAKKNSLVRRLPSVETLGAVSVLCVDKTGTITMNQMTVQEIWAPSCDDHILCETMGLGCETDAYDPMEKAMLRYCDDMGISKEHLFSGELVSEYAFTNDLKMMGHVWRRGGKLIIAAKGSPERLLPLCDMSAEEREAAGHMLVKMGKEGLRVIAVGKTTPANESEIPAKLTDCRLDFCGLIGLADPPRENVARDIATCNQAGVRVVMITGDNGITASSIARKIGMKDTDNIITADELESMTDDELREKVKTISIFSRVIPEHKMRIVKAFRDNDAIVAMTGDGVNDAPALKYADIGIAMGKRGSEVSREAADLILMDDNFSTIVDTIKDGRRIYDNIRKAVGYVFTIHIPIALSSLLAPILGIAQASLFLLPLHVVLLELIIDPTCSIVLEHQPAEEDIMNRPPRDPNEQMLTRKGLLKSVLQGFVMFASAFGIYYWTILQQPSNAPLARTMGLSVLMLSNLLLVLVNSSDHDSILHSVRRMAKDRVMWAVNIGVLVGLALILYTPMSSVLKLAPLTAIQLLTIVGLAIVSTCWFEIVKAIRRSRNRVGF